MFFAKTVLRATAISCMALIGASCAGTNGPSGSILPASGTRSALSTGRAYQATDTFTASANTTSATGIVAWSVFTGTQSGNEYDAFVGLDKTGRVVWEADVSHSTQVGWSKIVTNAKTNIYLPPNKGAPVITSQNLKVDAIYAEAMRLDMLAYKPRPGGIPGGPQPASQVRRTLTDPVTADSFAHGVLDVLSFIAGGAICTAGLPACLVIGGATMLPLAMSDANAITYQEGLLLLIFPPAFGLEQTFPLAIDAYYDYIDGQPVAWFTNEITVAIDGSLPPNEGTPPPLPPTYAPPPLPEPVYSNPISGNGTVGIGDSCSLNLDTESMQCIVPYN